MNTNDITDEERFLSFTKRSCEPPYCLEWVGAINDNGYGIFYHHGKMQLAHRVALSYMGTVASSSTHIRHLCNNRICVEPRHLQPGTPAQNVGDAIRDGKFRRKITQCIIDACISLRQAGWTWPMLGHLFHVHTDYLRKVVSRGRSNKRRKGYTMVIHARKLIDGVEQAPVFDDDTQMSII
ncbi:MAG: hypothetical protein ACYC27_00820 [Armatimonadota bacterium]